MGIQLSMSCPTARPTSDVGGMCPNRLTGGSSFGSHVGKHGLSWNNASPEAFVLWKPLAHCRRARDIYNLFHQSQIQQINHDTTGNAWKRTKLECPFANSAGPD